MSHRSYSFEVFDFSFALDPDTSTITSVHPPAIHVIFEINPFAAQRWADGNYYSLVDCTSPEVAPFLTNTTVEKLSNKRVANQLHENLNTALKLKKVEPQGQQLQDRLSVLFKLTYPAPLSQNGAG